MITREQAGAAGSETGRGCKMRQEIGQRKIIEIKRIGFMNTKKREKKICLRRN